MPPGQMMTSVRFYYFSDFILHLRIDVILTLKFAIRDFILQSAGFTISCLLLPMDTDGRFMAATCKLQNVCMVLTNYYYAWTQMVVSGPADDSLFIFAKYYQ